MRAWVSLLISRTVIRSDRAGRPTSFSSNLKERVLANRKAALRQLGRMMSRAALLAVLTALLGATASSAQTTQSIGLPIIFVHGICDMPDSWIPAEQDVRTYLYGKYPTLYQQGPEYVTFYDGTKVNFEYVDNYAIANGLPQTPLSLTSISSAARFFLVALDDPGETIYSQFDETNNVANIPIYQKGNELAHIIWAIKQITGAPRVIVVGHSMGGLDSRAYVEGLASPNGTTDPPIQYLNDIAELVTLDTPHGGSDFAGLSAAGLSFLLGACHANASINKAEMSPSGLSLTNLLLGYPSIMPQLNYTLGATSKSLYTANPTPSALTITSIASYWYNPGLFSPPDEGTDDVLTSLTQDMYTNLADPQFASRSTLVPVNNTFAYVFPEHGNTGNSCGLPPSVLHTLTCTGSQSQTFGYLEKAVFPFVTMAAGQVQITPASSTIAPGSSSSFSASTGSSTVWSILEGQVGGNLTPANGDTVSYQAPSNYTHSTTTFHIVAINSQDPSQYAIVPIQVTSSFGKTTTTTVLAPSATQVPIGAALTISATVQGSGGIPTGTVTFYDGGTSLSPEIVNNAGVATYTTSSLSLGFHSITARYSGDSNYTTSTSSLVTIAVVAIAPQLSVSPTSGILGVTAFVKTDTGFTPYGLITHTATLPGGSLSVLQTYAGEDGTYSYSRTYSTAGIYSQIDTDGASGRTTTPVAWTVSTAAVNDFSLQASPAAQTVIQGGSVAYNVVTATTSGSSQSVSLGIANLPSGITASFSPATITSGSQSTLILTASSSVAAGIYNLILGGAGTSANDTFPISVTVTQAGTGPLLTLSPSILPFNSQAVGSVSAPETVSLMNNGSGQLKISSIALLAGSDYALTLPSPAPPNILNPLVPYNIQVAFEPTTTGTRNGEIIVYDNAPGSPHIISLTGTGTPAPPTTGTINVNATLNGVALPNTYGYQYSLVGPATYTGYDGYSFAVTPGSYTVSFTSSPTYLTLASVTPSATQSVAAGGSISYTLNFTAPDDFYGPTILFPQGGGSTPQIVPAGSTATYLVDVTSTPGSASSPITLSVAGAPPNSTPSFAPQPVYSGGGGTLSVGTTAGSTPPGVYTLTVSGTNVNGVTHTGATSSLAVTTPPAAPVLLVSQSSTGVQGNWASSFSGSSVSGDGRYFVFSSASTNLVASDTSGHSKVLLRDLQSGTTSEVSVSTSGIPADSDSYGGAISANGQYVAFTSSAGNLYPGSVQTHAWCGVYVRDVVHGITEREDVVQDGTAGNADSCGGAAISADGRFVAFVSDDTNLISGTSGMQVYLRDRKTAHMSLISSASDGSTGNAPSSGVAISADGRYVAFTALATNLVPQNTGGLNEAFVRDTQSGVTSLVSISSNGLPANASISLASSSIIAMSADGRFVVFASPATNLAPHPTDYATHVFLYDRQLGNTMLVDVDSVGTPLGGGSFVNPAISADGRFIAFWGFLQFLVRDTVESQTAVVSLAANGQPDNNTTGDGNSSVSMGGPHVAFASFGTNLVVNDTNGQADAFAATNPFVGSGSLISLSLNTSSTSGGSTVNGTVTLNGPAPIGGATVTVWSNNAVAQPPAVVVVPAGATNVVFSFGTSLVSSETVMTIMASYNGGSGVALLTLEPTAELAVSPATWDFGDQSVGTTSSTESFALTNSGTAALTINSVQLSLGQVFSITANTCGSGIAVGGSCSITVTFSPSASGSASDALQFSYGSPATIQSISLAGNGATPLASVSPGTLTFTSPANPTAIATLTNSGNASLSNVSTSISGTNAGDFAISSDGCSGNTLPANSSCLVTVTFSPRAAGTRLATLAVTDAASGSPQIVGLSGTEAQATPVVLWSPSASSLTYGAPLGSGVLDATASVNGNTVAGTFVYTAAISGGAPQAVSPTTVLGAGAYTLTTTFTPNDTTDYTTATATTSVTRKSCQSVDHVERAGCDHVWKSSGRNPTQRHRLCRWYVRLFTRALGAILAAGSHSLGATFTPTDNADYTSATAGVSITVNQATPAITWQTPAPITNGTALSSTQLDATASVPGMFVYSPAAGTALASGSHILSVTFTPTDLTDYTTAMATVSIAVGAITPTITWNAPVPITYGSPLTQPS
jgi:hypothetical protein